MIILSANKDHLILYFSIHLPFVLFWFFACIIVLARATNTMLYKSGDSKNFCLFLIVREKNSVSHLKYDASYRLFTDAL